VRASFRDDKSISTTQARFAVRHQVEALLLQPRLELVAGESYTVLGLGSNIVEIGFQPAELAHNLAVVDAVSELDKQRERYVSCAESTCARSTPAAALRSASAVRALRWRLQRRPRVCAVAGINESSREDSKRFVILSAANGSRPARWLGWKNPRISHLLLGCCGLMV